MKLKYYIILIFLILPQFLFAENKPERLEWFRDLGFGMFIHWGVDSQIGTVISHSMVGASDEYVQKFINDLPANFNPQNFNPQAWARLAKTAGFKYVVFTTKHHSGFCMFDSKTNNFNIMHTPYGKDITAEIVKAFRDAGIQVGFYFSPDDFYVLHQQGTLISRRRPEVLPLNNPELMQTNKAQVKELMTQYGPIDIVFFDGQENGLVDLTWELQPDAVITRGAMNTPEIAPSTSAKLPNMTDIEPWEACFTLGTSWQYKPTNEKYMSANEVIKNLIETRAKGGNMLMNIGPDPEGEIPMEQQNILREVGLWMFVNGEAVYNVLPWKTAKSDSLWFTRHKTENTVYAFVTGAPWKWGQEKTLLLPGIKISNNTTVSILGQNDKVLEYNTERIPKTTWQQMTEGLQITATRAQRLYNDRTWPNPVVFKITNIKE